MLNSFVKMGVVELSLSSFVFKTCVSVAHILQLQIIVEKNVLVIRTMLVASH